MTKEENKKNENESTLSNMPFIDADLTSLQDKSYRKRKGISVTQSRKRCEMWDCDISQIIKLLTSIATNLWRARLTALDKTSNVSDGLRKTLRHYEASWDLLINSGFEICDHTDEPYPEGSSLKVIAFQPMPGYGKLTVAQTIKPTIYFNEKKVQEGEVIVAIPDTKDDINQKQESE